MVEMRWFMLIGVCFFWLGRSEGGLDGLICPADVQQYSEGMMHGAQ